MTTPPAAPNRQHLKVCTCNDGYGGACPKHPGSQPQEEMRGLLEEAVTALEESGYIARAKELLKVGRYFRQVEQDNRTMHRWIEGLVRSSPDGAVRTGAKNVLSRVSPPRS